MDWTDIENDVMRLRTESDHNISNKLKITFAENLSYQLQTNGLKQSELARKLNLPEMTVSNWVNAKTYPRVDKLQLLSDFFGVTKAELVERKNTNICIAEKISYFRTNKGLTQEQLASLLGVSKQSVSNWETGLKFPRFKFISELANIFNVSVTELVSNDSTTSDSDLSIFIGNKIKVLRETNGLTQDDLATNLGLTRQSISRYETGERKVSLDILYDLAKTFSVSMDSFFPAKATAPLCPDINEKLDIGQAINNLLDRMYRADDVTFFGRPMNEHSKDNLKIAIQMALELNKGVKK